MAEAMREFVAARCIPEPNTGCWLWLLSTNAAGYGQAVFRKTHWLAHRLSFVAFKGEIPNGMLIQHSCDNPLCVNPDHLSIGTDATNNHDKQSKGRAAKRLTTEQVAAIRASSATDVVAAREFGVSRSMIQKIRSRENWSHVPGGGTNRNPVKFNTVSACIARHLYRRGHSIAVIADAFDTSEGYMQHILSRRRWADWKDVTSGVTELDVYDPEAEAEMEVARAMADDDGTRASVAF